MGLAVALKEIKCICIFRQNSSLLWHHLPLTLFLNLEFLDDGLESFCHVVLFCFRVYCSEVVSRRFQLMNAVN